MDNYINAEDLRATRAEVTELTKEVSSLKTTVAVLSNNISHLLEERRTEQAQANALMEWVRRNMDGGISAKVDHLEKAFTTHAEQSSTATKANAKAIAKLQSYVVFASGAVFVLSLTWAVLGDLIKEAIRMKVIGR